MVRFGRCAACLGAASERDGRWWHDPGRACGMPGADFSPVPPFDPIGHAWVINDPAAVVADLPDLPGPMQHSAARELLHRYERPLAEVGVVDVGTLLAYASALRHDDTTEQVSFTDPVVSTDYAPDGGGSDAAGEGQEPWETPQQPLVQRSSGRRPRSSTTLLPVPDQPSTEDEEGEEEDLGPSPLTL